MEFMLLGIGTSGGLLQTRKLIFELYKRQNILYQMKITSYTWRTVSSGVTKLFTALFLTIPDIVSLGERTS
jgi:hypothetical protein